MKASLLKICASLVITASPLISIPGWAQAGGSNSDYSFGGACTSQGQWTQVAMEATHRIAQVVSKLKDNPNCHGLGDTMRGLIGQADQNLSGMSDNGSSNRLMNIPTEISALRSFSATSNTMKGNVLKLIMDRGVEGAMLAAQVGASNIAGTPGADLLSLGQRTQRAANSSLNLLDGVLDNSANLDKCLANKDFVGQMLAASVSMASSFISSGQSFSKRVAKTISHLSEVLIQKKYASVIKKLNEQEFLNSMSCLIETTSEAYCSARDAVYLFKKTVNDLKIRAKGSAGAHITRNGLSVESPFEGYYLLTQEVPIVTEWLQKIQIGVDPKLTTDALFQNKILDDMQNHLRRMKIVQGLYSERLYKLQKRTDVATKRNDLLEMLRALFGAMSSSGTPNSADLVNFFSIIKADPLLPFYLIGMDVLPDIVAGKDANRAPLEWSLWMYNGGDFGNVKGFQDPDQLALVVGDNLRKLIAASNIEANAYFNKWFIVDKPALVGESVSSFRYSVTEVLGHIDQYLTTLLTKIEKFGGDPVLIGSINDTKTRIRRVLDSYEGIRKLSELKAPFTDEQTEKVSIAYQTVVEEVFKQFNMMLQKSGFIENRVAKFVFADYALMLRKQVNFTSYEEELFYVTGQGIMDRMIQLYSNNPAFTKTDLESAATINLNNIVAMEMLLKDNLISSMARLKMISENEAPGDWKLTKNSLQRLKSDVFHREMVDGKLQTQFQRELPVLGTISYRTKYLLYPLFIRKWLNSDRYPLGISMHASPGTREDEFHSHRQVLAKLCIQSMAFTDWQAFIPFCKGISLDTFIEGLDGSAEQGLTVNYDDKVLEDSNNKPMNQSKRICAFRDWGRHNYVFWQTLLLNRK